MNNIKQTDAECALYAEDISDDDIFEAMKEVSGYIDITLEDFRDIYRHAYRHAHSKVTAAGSVVRMSSAEIPESGAGDENSAQHDESGLVHVAKKYFKKMRGSEHSPPRVSLKETMWSWIGDRKSVV